MNSAKIYYQEPYLKELKCRVVSCEPAGNLTKVILDQTIFYPEGGGQPSDRGVIKSKKWSARVQYVHSQIDGVIHQTAPEEAIKIGDEAYCLIDWPWRFKHMRIHSAGHLLHDVLMSFKDGLKPIRASHGKKAFIEYSGILDPNIKAALEEKANQTIRENLPIITKETTLEEIEKECPFLPPNLPRDKKLRIIKIGNFPPMPDGGIQVKSTKEIGKIWIANIISSQDKTIIRYGITN